MNINRKMLKKYLPPVLLDTAKWLKRSLVYAEWEYIKQGWVYSNPKIKGWNIDEIAGLQLQKWDRFCKAIKSPSSFTINHELDDFITPDIFSHNIVTSFNYVCALSAHQEKILRLLDWGGGIGHYGYIANEALPGITVEYSNYDLSAFEKPFKQLFPDSFFINTVNDLKGKYHLVNISSSLWYDINWKSTLTELSKYTDKYFYITRMIFIQTKPTYVAIQRPYIYGYHTEYLCWIFNESELVSFVEKLGFSLIRKFYFGKAPYIHKAPEQGELSGLLFEKEHEEI